MTEFIYTDDTYQRLRMNDMRVQKENTSTKQVTKENGEIITKFQVISFLYSDDI